MTTVCAGVRLNVLVVYNYDSYPSMRPAIRDHLFSFGKYSPHRVFYLNFKWFRTIPWYLQSVHFDVVIFHTVFLSTRWEPSAFDKLRQRARDLRHSPAIKLALPQDEFVHTDELSDFINDFGVTHVFSVAPSSEWKKIYRRLDHSRVKFHQVLTGYIDEQTVEQIGRIATETGGERDIDIGYRAWRAEPWLGRHGVLKVRIAEEFKKRAPLYGLRTDISTRSEDTITGDDWFRFALRCRYFIGVEGGASILDRDGSIGTRTAAFCRSHPDASFEEVEKECFPGQDGTLELFAMSPRHLEACATRTCQLLVEGQYNGILVPGRHFIELKRDFSNIDEMLGGLNDEKLRHRLAEQAYEDVVGSGRYSYRTFVEGVFRDISPELKSRSVSPADRYAEKAKSWLGLNSAIRRAARRSETGIRRGVKELLRKRG